MMLRGWALAEQGQETQGVAQMREGFTVWQANGQELGQPFWLALLGRGYARIGQVEEGLRVLAEAAAMADTRGLRVWEAELNRLRGELLLQRAASDGSGVETCFRRAIDIALKQQAKSLELRVATSLSRLWQQQGKRDAARKRMEESYVWFSEGFDTADLQEAMALRAALERQLSSTLASGT
jgi:predicted ATPase